MFPSSSQQVPQDIPDITSILSHIVWTEFNFHVNCKNGSITKLLFSGVGAKGVLLLGTAHYSRKIGDGRNQCGSFKRKKKRKKNYGAPMNLINWNTQFLYNITFMEIVLLLPWHT